MTKKEIFGVMVLMVPLYVAPVSANDLVTVGVNEPPLTVDNPLTGWKKWAAIIVMSITLVWADKETWAEEERKEK